MLLLLIASVLALGGAAYFVLDAITVNQREREASLRRARAYGRQQRQAGTRRPLRAGAIELLGGAVLRLRPRTNVDALALRVRSAGLGHVFSWRELLAAKAGLAGVSVLVGILFAASAGGPLHGLVWPIALGVAGYISPDLVLSSRIRKRRQQILPALPDALDLLAVSVEAGLGLDGAIQKLVEYTDGPLADELGFTLDEMRIGESRQDALKKLADRVDSPELASVTRAIIQADQQGSSLGRILRVQASDARVKRQIAAEEKANKAPVKMLFPTTLFIFPALFVVILGPAVLTLSKSL